MNVLLGALLLSRVVSSIASGCTQALPAEVTPGVTSPLLHLKDSTGDRTYHIYVPASYTTDSPVPLILSFHGRGENATKQEALDGLTTPEFTRGMIVVYPNGAQNTSRAPRQWFGDPQANPSINDLLFVSNLLDHLLARYCIDPSMVFATGTSNGGGLVHLLACDPVLSSRIAAFAPVSMAIYTPQSIDYTIGPCTPSGRVPFLEFHGVKDETIPYAGGLDDQESNPGRGLNFTTVWALSSVERWAEWNNCTADATETLCVGHDKPPVTRYSWVCEGAEGLVEHYAISNLGHVWPSTIENGDNRGRGSEMTCFNASEKIVDFFLRPRGRGVAMDESKGELRK